MPNTYEVVGTCDPDGTLRPYGTTAPKAPGNRNDPIVVGKKYILASGAHTGGTAIPEATCLAVNGSNALMITHGLYGDTPTSAELDISSYMSGLSVAISDAYLPRAQGGITGPTTTTPTGVSVYWNGTWSDAYSASAKNALMEASSRYAQVGSPDHSAWLGTSYDSDYQWRVMTDGTISQAGNPYPRVIAPTFILDLTRVQISGAYISLANPEGQVDAHNVTYGDSDVDTALTELSSKMIKQIIVDVGGKAIDTPDGLVGVYQGRTSLTTEIGADAIPINAYYVDAGYTGVDISVFTASNTGPCIIFTSPTSTTMPNGIKVAFLYI